MIKLRYIVDQKHGDLRWPFDRACMTTIMDEEGRRVVSSGPDEYGGQYQRSTAYARGGSPQYSYPLSVRRKM
jgi:hypothetical protein